jgi:hypothetical protein
MVGPSLPITPPPNIMKRLDSIFTKMMRMLSNLLTLSMDRGVASSMEAITCGIPLPREYGENFITSHQEIRKQTGVNINNHNP